MTFRTAREGLIPVFEAEPVEVAESKVENDTSGVTSQSGGIEVDYSNVVREKISNGEVLWVSGLARSLETDGLDRDIAKLKIRNALRRLLDAGDVQVQRLDDPASGETVSLCQEPGRERESFAQMDDQQSRGAGGGPARGLVGRGAPGHRDERQVH